MSGKKSDHSVSIMLDHQYLGSLKQSLSQSSCKNTSDTFVAESKEQETDELNANAIQQCFQNMLQMTALSDLDSKKQSLVDNVGECKVLRLELSFDSSIGSSSATSVKSNSVSSNKDPKLKPDTGEPRSKKKEVSQITTLATEDDEKRQKEWKKLNRDFQEEVRYNALLQYTMALLIKRWMEYLAFPSEQMYKFELENARASNLTDDVIEILQDRDLHVWQIIDMINDS